MAAEEAARAVSIHAPVKGATGATHKVKTADKVSIHAPVKGATGVLPAQGEGAAFQSTRP